MNGGFSVHYHVVSTRIARAGVPSQLGIFSGKQTS